MKATDYYQLKAIVLGLRDGYLSGHPFIRLAKSCLQYDEDKIRDISFYINSFDGQDSLFIEFLTYPEVFDDIKKLLTLFSNDSKDSKRVFYVMPNLPIDENEYNSNDSDGNTFNIKFRRQGSIVSLHITATLLSGAFGQRIAGQLGFTDGTVPEKYRPREIIRSKENYAINSGASMQILAYLSVLANTNNSFVIQYNNIDTQTQYLEINLMYFGKEV